MGFFGKKKERDAKKEAYGTVVAFVIEALRTQMGEMEGIVQTPAGPALPKIAMDDFSLGYVAGFVESLVVFRSLESDENKSYALYQIVFTDLFGPKTGPFLFARFMKESGENSPNIAAGMERGGADLFGWLNGDRESPNEWADYVNRN